MFLDKKKNKKLITQSAMFALVFPLKVINMEEQHVTLWFVVLKLNEKKKTYI